MQKGSEGRLLFIVFILIFVFFGRFLVCCLRAWAFESLHCFLEFFLCDLASNKEKVVDPLGNQSIDVGWRN